MWLLVLSSLESAIFVGCGGGGEGGKYNPKSLLLLLGARGSSCSGSTSAYSCLGSGDGDGGGTTSRAGGIWRRIGDMGLVMNSMFFAVFILSQTSHLIIHKDND